MIDDDDDRFLYGEPEKETGEEKALKPVVPTSVPQPISLEQTQSLSQGLVSQLEAEAAEITASGTPDGEAENDRTEGTPPEEEGDDEEEEDSDDDVEIIMEPTSRSLDLRQQRPTGPRVSSGNITTPSRPPQQPQPSLTTEYTPLGRGGATKLSSTPQPTTTTPLPALPATPGSSAQKPAEGEQPTDTGPDPSTLPPATAPPSHPKIDPTAPGTLDGRSILDVDLAALAEKPWRRPGSDVSDWFNYGFDELSWEAYCYRRREIGELANVLKANVLTFAGMPEEQLTALPPEIRTMVMAGATAMMANGGANGAGMIPPGMNGNAMMSQMMNMGGMMNPMMQEMGPGVGMGMGMNGEMMPGMQMGGAAQGMPMGPGAQGMGGPPGQGMMQEGVGPGVGAGAQGGQGTPEQQMGMGVSDGYGPGGSGPGAGMMGMGMGGEFGMQDPSAMGQQMYPGMEGSGTPVPAPTPVRGGPPGPFRGRGIPQGMGMRGRGGGGFAGRGRVPVRPASPLPPNVPTGPRNKNKYKDIDGSAPAVDGLDYGGGGGSREVGRGTPDQDERSSRKRRGSPGMDDSRGSKRR
ncbi:hypothetical protein CERSUDRAFT_110784 [Gelatoporia subvermispora B]|uniref:Pre-mRNA polyadenylation factor Fip1 domain-containing protein n=1 Tax=Ceriporiopsis subvermispora (strain B) TaxID=914234 RepID=M2PZ90_CERS8|nr:hypothetical protein CERSUDRAFT_110784 [Gelatoporia subvermispora B]